MILCVNKCSHMSERLPITALFSVSKVENIGHEKKKILCQRGFLKSFLFVHLPFHSFRVCCLQTLWSPSGLLSIKMKTSLSLLIPILYFLSALLVCVIKITAHQAKMDSDSNSLWLVQTTNCL